MTTEHEDPMPTEGVKLDPGTLQEVARMMRETIGEEIPVGPAQTGAFNVTLSWAAWLDQQAVQIRAAL